MDVQEYCGDARSLHLAISTNAIEQVQELIKEGIDGKLVDGYGYTAIELSALLGRGRCLQLLTQRDMRLIKVVGRGEHIVTKHTPEAFLRTMGVAYSPTLHFTDLAGWLSVLAESSWLWRESRVGEEMRLKGDSLRSQILSGCVANLTIVWMGHPLGYGVITNRTLAPGTYLGTYTGAIRRIYRLRPYWNAYCVHYPVNYWTRHYYVIDARRYGNELRYVNHSTTPNVTAAWAYDRNLLHLLFFAAKEIPRGTPLTIDYGEDFWRHRHNGIYTPSTSKV
jgi:hypothetical protein